MSKLFISYASTQTDIPIIALQAGLGLQHLVCVGQVIWERYVSDRFATWGDPIHKKDFLVGSMYSFKSVVKNNSINETLILPQVPSFSLPRCFSCYWGLAKDDFKSQMSNMLDKIDNVLSTSKSPIFRIKHVDLMIYKNTVFKHFNNVKVDYGNVNKIRTF